MSDRRTITVVGAGLMGQGIALVMARAGHDVNDRDALRFQRLRPGARVAGRREDDRRGLGRARDRNEVIL